MATSIGGPTLWWISDSEKLSTVARETIGDESNAVAVSAAAAWEIATKFRLGKLPGCESVATDVAGHIRGQGFEAPAIDVADAERAGRLPGPHRDPFDRMLAAQALARESGAGGCDYRFACRCRRPPLQCPSGDPGR